MVEFPFPLYCFSLTLDYFLMFIAIAFRFFRAVKFHIKTTFIPIIVIELK